MNTSQQPYPPNYVMLSDNHGDFRPPPYRRNIPRYKSHKGSGGKCCLKCICCFYCFLFLFIFVLAAFTFYLYSVYQPKIPSYKVDSFNVHAFNVNQDLSIYSEFLVRVKADNPNENIGFVYGKDSSVSVYYTSSVLCSGKIPAFHQPPKNVSMIDISLKGKSEFGSGIQEALMANKEKGEIPLLVMVKAPVSVVLGAMSFMGEIPLRQIVVNINCSLVVDNLSPNKKIQILSSKYEYGVDFGLT